MNLEGVRSVHESTAPTRLLGPGITSVELWKEASGRAVFRVDIAPGAKWPELDVHQPGPELVYVLAGDFGDGNATYPKGSLLHHPRGTSHWPQSVGGCSLLVIFPDG